MRAFCIVRLDPCIEISLELVDGLVDLFAEGDPVELVEHRLVQAFNDAVALRTLGFRSRMIDVCDREVELIGVLLGIAALLRAAIGQDPENADVVVFKKRRNAIVEQIGVFCSYSFANATLL